MASTGNPLERTVYSSSTPISSKPFNISGILVHVLGLSELPPSCTSLTILYLLHPRLQKAESMIPIGTLVLNTWNARLASLPPSHPSKSHGLLAITFDQRNHGTRLVDDLANGSWRDGNDRHAQDMFGLYHGTARDTSFLIDQLGSYIFADFAAPHPPIERNLVLGISLGGHAAWQLLFADPRVQAGCVVIGCPDYIRVMTDRARLSKRATYLSSPASFLGSPDFPPPLLSLIQAHDPRGLLFGLADIPTTPTAAEAARLRPLLDARVRGKSVLVCSGAADKLVPYAASEPFLGFLKAAVREGGWWEGGMGVCDRVYEGVGHEMSEGMVEDCVGFVVEIMEGRGGLREGEVDKGKGSKI